jgi:hypothetical protein
MSVSKQDREDYEQGQRDRHSSFFDQAVWDITGQHPDSSAYYKGRDGEQLDEDKKEK